MLADFTVRAFRAGDEAAILDLFNRSFPHAPRSLEHFRWKYQRNPFGNERISLAFDEEGRLVGHYAGYPLRLTTGEEVHHIGDTMTDPAVRHVGRGPTSILGRIAQHFYTTFCEHKIAFNFGFNAANIQKFSTRFLRAERVAPVAYRLWSEPPRIARWQRWARGYQIEVAGSRGLEVPELATLRDPEAARPRDLMVRRDAQYLRWRYLQCPDIDYLFLALRRWRKLAGWSVFRVKDERLLWVDGLFDSPSSAAILLRQVAQGRTIVAWGDHAAPFEPQPEPQDLGLMCVPFVMGDAVERMRAGFRYAMGDSDLA